MSYIPISPFRRAADYVVLENIQTTARALPSHSVNKWHVLRDLGTARQHFGVTDRQLTVLQALLSFHPDTALSAEGTPLVVFPSNAAICARLNGMPCSTMRRHLAALVEAGLIQRRDSPNGKRYRRRNRAGTEAFGFDLSPLLRLSADISEAAETAQKHEEALQQLRQTVSLMRRDLTALAAYGLQDDPQNALWDRLNDLALLTARKLKRKLNLTELDALRSNLSAALREAVEPYDLKYPEMSSSDAQNEQHIQNSNKEKTIKKTTSPSITKVEQKSPDLPDDPDLAAPKTTVPLAVVLGQCKEINTYSQTPLFDWRSFMKAAETVRPMMGITDTVWQRAVQIMGLEQAAIVVAAILERFGEIRSPGAYLTKLTAKSAAGEFTCLPMLMALGNSRLA